MSEFEWPAIEWVKVPVALKSGHPSGVPIRMRHLSRCDHWYRSAGDSWVGDDPYVASDDQMRGLPACKDCQDAARRERLDQRGPRIAPEPSALARDGDVEHSIPVKLDIHATDSAAMVQVRREQSYLRRRLFGGTSLAACALCDRKLPSDLLIAAHIVPRRLLSDAERLNFESAAMLACALGCDALFELGYLIVDDDGLVMAGSRSTSLPVAADLVGKRCTAHTDLTATNFRRHRELHTARTD